MRADDRLLAGGREFLTKGRVGDLVHLEEVGQVLDLDGLDTVLDLADGREGLIAEALGGLLLIPAEGLSYTAKLRAKASSAWCWLNYHQSPFPRRGA